tara:strand:+ start:443 stop:1057 length:615 start_codon:yes stop_codon:yes gene_type:complete
MAGERLPAKLSLRSKLWFLRTEKCSKTATSHMQTVRRNLMKQVIYILFLLSFTVVLAQSDSYKKVRIEFLPSFISSSFLDINFSNSYAILRLDTSSKSHRIRLTESEQSNLMKAIHSLVSESRPPIDTVKVIGGNGEQETIVIDGRLSEDGMSTRIILECSNIKEFGNSYSKSESEQLAKIISLLKTKFPKMAYLRELDEYIKY